MRRSEDKGAGIPGKERANKGGARRCRCEMHVRRQASSAPVVDGRTERSKPSYRKFASAALAMADGYFSAIPDEVQDCRSDRARSRRHRLPPDWMWGLGIREMHFPMKPVGGFANRRQPTR